MVIALAGAVVNGALGYGFSSITVPVALLFLTGRVLNAALVPIEVALNAYVLWVNRAALPQVWRRVVPVMMGLAPGVMAGTLVVSLVNPSWLKLSTFALLLPVILVQAVGVRRPIRSERSAGFALGAGVGLLYAVTTISGPPLALALNNQGFSKHEFRAALGIVRLAESTLTVGLYLAAGLFTRDSVAIMPPILFSVVVGVPVGAVMIRHLRAETFRRLCLSFDAWIVSFGVSKLARDLHLVDSAAAYMVMVAAVAVDAWLLTRFFSHAQKRSVTCAA
jgi:uncharacterized protein